METHTASPDTSSSVFQHLRPGSCFWTLTVVASLKNTFQVIPMRQQQTSTSPNSKQRSACVGRMRCHSSTFSGSVSIGHRATGHCSKEQQVVQRLCGKLEFPQPDLFRQFRLCEPRHRVDIGSMRVPLLAFFGRCDQIHTA